MVVDASALIAILAKEPDWRDISLRLKRAAMARISAVNWYETAVNAEKYGASNLKALESLMKTAGIEIVSVDEEQTRLAHAAWRKYGKGRHEARLNMGDCFAYALAKSLNEPLLFKGDDFPHTDVIAAV